MKKSTRQKEAIEEAKKLEKAFTIEERKAVYARKNKIEESVYDLLGVNKTDKIYYESSMQAFLLKLLYEILLPKAQKTGKNQILIPNTMEFFTKQLIKNSENLGMKVKEVKVNAKGIIEKEGLEKSITERSLAFLSFWIDSVTGAIYPIFELAKLCKDRGVFCYVDSSESVGKVLFRYQDLDVDMLSCSYGSIVAVAGKNESLMMKQNWNKNILLEDFFSFSVRAYELLEKMDIEPYEYAKVKNEVIDTFEGKNRCQFFNKGRFYLFDRWCFGFSDILAENLAFFLRQKNIFVEHVQVEKILLSQGVDKQDARTAVVWKFDLNDSIEKILSNWNEVMKVVEKIGGMSVR